MKTLLHWLGQIGKIGVLFPRAGEAPRYRLRVESSVRLGPLHTVHAVTLGPRRWILVCDSRGTTVLSPGRGHAASNAVAAGGSPGGWL